MVIEIQPGLLYLTRADWGARTDIPRLGYQVNRLARTEAIMHHTVITPNIYQTLAEVKAKMVQLQTIRPDLGLDVPYNFVAFHMADGALIVCEGRGLDRTGAHTHAHNTGGMATAGQGNFNLGQSLAPYVGHWSRWWGWLKFDEGMTNLGTVHPPGGIAYGHRDLSSTACPGANLYAIIPQMEFKEEDDMDEAAVRQLFQELMAEHVTDPTTHYSLDQIRDNLPDLNQHLRGIVAGIADSRIAASGAVPAGHGHPHQHGEAG